MDTIVEVEHLRKTYGSTVAVEDISFTVCAGEIFGIVGPNGAGKTTTIECIVGLRTPTAGVIRVLGMDPQRQSKALRQRLGVQLQQAALPDRIKVWEALDLFASFYDQPADPAALLKQWGLEEKRNSAFATLSGGQKQRLFIALSLINNPAVVFLDELTTGLDPQARRATWELISDIRRRGTTVILVTHFMEEAERLCDRLAIIDHGRLIALDTPQRLIASLDQETCVRFTLPKEINLAMLEQLPHVSRVLRQGDEVAVYGSGPVMAQVAGVLASHDIVPADLRSQQATLEDVFLKLTGHAMRE
ncbi:ABC transporter ATP-binding protein [Kallotenue papyrolyticum]|uniref:ABC transporter ATP-binding protein n=1 Tax=Kallotenue papyrolyticum TaxID=1325125 RepID=UPI0004BCC4D1|nr:ABC transporter ATP-binding protein [Kallotenue papyrolyticum]